jgi:hypothetical protein
MLRRTRHARKRSNPPVKIDACCHLMPRLYYDRFFQLNATQHSVNLRSRADFITSITAADVDP